MSGPVFGGDDVDRVRDAITEDVHRWCAEARVGSELPALSDRAAVLIASGALDPSIRATLARRRAAGLDVPDVGGFARLRQIARAHDALAARLGEGVAMPLRMLLTSRRDELRRRLEAARRDVVGGFRGRQGRLSVRRARKEGLLLTDAEADMFFRALLATPAPVDRALVGRFASPLVDGLAAKASELLRGVGSGARTGGLGRAGDWVSAQLEAVGGVGGTDGTFVDSYEALLFLAGAQYDRLTRSRAWESDLFLAERAMVDLEMEIVQISADTAELRALLIELERIALGGGPEVSDHVARRRRALRSVWEELVGRVAALARIGEAVSRVESMLRVDDARWRADALDGRIAILLGGAVERGVSTDSLNDVGARVDGVDPLLLGWRATVAGDIGALRGRSG